MKTTLMFLILAASQITFAAEVTITDSRFNSETTAIELDVEYGGGCKEHNFELVMNACNRMTPMACIMDLVDHTQDDSCRMLVKKTISFPAAEYMQQMNEVMVLDTHGTGFEVPLMYKKWYVK